MRWLSTLVVVCAALLVAASSADARPQDPQTVPPVQQTTPPDPQTVPPDPQSGLQPERPYQGLFAAQGRVPTAQSLTFMTTLGGGYDTNILGGGAANPGVGIGLGTAVPEGPAQPSTFENGSASLAYSFSGSRISFGATAATSANYYAAFTARPLVVSDSGSMGTAWQATRRTQISASVAASYGPFFSLPGVPVVPVAPDNAGQTAAGQTQGQPAGQTPGQPLGQTLTLDGGSALFVTDYLNVTGGVALTHEVTRRLSLSLNYGDTDITTPSHTFDLSAQSYGGGFSYRLAQGLSAQLFYTEWTGHFGVGQTPTTSRGLNGGLAFNRSLSITRRTVLSFNSGVSAYSNAAILNGRPQYFLSVQAALVRELGRTWTASLAYNRSESFVETFLQPVFSDSVTAGIGGRLSRRVQLQTSVGVASGNVGLLASLANAFRTYFASAGLRLDASRTVSVGFDYAYYQYRFGGGVQLPPGLEPQSELQSARVYVSLWAPLMSRGRIPNAAR